MYIYRYIRSFSMNSSWNLIQCWVDNRILIDFVQISTIHRFKVSTPTQTTQSQQHNPNHCCEAFFFFAHMSKISSFFTCKQNWCPWESQLQPWHKRSDGVRLALRCVWGKVWYLRGLQFESRIWYVCKRKTNKHLGQLLHFNSWFVPFTKKT